MPLIPRTSESVQLQASAPVQIASTSDARIEGNAIADFGGSLQRVAGAVNEFKAKQELKAMQITRDEFANAVHNNAKLAAQKAENDAAVDGSDLNKKYAETSEPVMNELINQYGTTPELKKEFESYSKRIQTNVQTDLTIKSAQMLESNNFKRAEGLMQSSANRLREDVPLSDKSVANFVRAEISANTNLVNNLDLGPKNSEAAKKAYLMQSSTAFIDGLSNKQRYGEALRYLTATEKSPDIVAEYAPAEAQALGFVTSKEAEALTNSGENYKQPILTSKKGEKIDPAITHLLSGLSQPQRAAAIDRMRAKVQEQAQVRASDLNQSLSGYEKFRMQGGVASDAERATLVQSINSLPNATPISKQRLVDRVMTADAIGDQMRTAATTPRSELGTLVSKASSSIEAHVNEAATRDPRLANNRDFAIMENRQNALNQFQTSIAQMVKAQDADPAGFLLKKDPEIAHAARGVQDGTGVEKFTTTLMSKQKYLGMPQAAVSKAQAYGIAQQLGTNPDPMATNDFLNSLQSQYGKHFPEVMKQVVKEDKGLAPLAAVVYADPYSRQSAVDAVKAAPQLKIEFAKPERKVEAEQIDQTSQQIMGNFRTAIMGGTSDTSRLSVVQSMQDLIKVQAQRDVFRGADPKDAVKKAYGDIVDANYAVVTGGSSSVLVPRQLVAEPKIVQSFLSVYEPKKSSEGGKFDPLISLTGPRANADLVNDFQIAGKNVEARNMRWTTNDAQTGIKLVEVMRDGSLQPVYNKSKQKVEVSYDDINMRPGKKVLEQSKTTIQKLFGG
jgi:hypothetical protein